MPKLFQINLREGMSSVKLDSQGRATAQYTVKNVSQRPIDARAVLISLPQVTPPIGPVEKGWVTIDGKTDRHLDIDKEETFTVKINVPPKSAPGNYTFRLDTVWVDETDQGDQGGAIAFTVAAPTTTSHFPLWLIPVLVVVVIGIGVGIYFLIPKGATVPNLQGKTIPDATSTLTALKLSLDSDHVETIQSKPEDSDKIVSQTPSSGTKAKPGDSVHVKVGAEMVVVPAVVLHSFNEAQSMLTAIHLSVGQVTNEANPVVASGVVFKQFPDSGGAVLTGSAVNLWVTPRTVPVPNVVGMTAGEAWKTIQGASLVAVLHGDQVTQPVIAQNPPAQAQAVVGTTVDVTVPNSRFCIPMTRCIYFGNAARLMVNPHPTAVPRVNLFQRPP
jgi:beta-lactam-binding protein with PASTA domain